MLYNFVELKRGEGVPLSRQLYEELRRGIEGGRLRPGEKLLSIRRASEELGLSRTTVENAYQRLMLLGYVESRPQSGYRVRESLPVRKDMEEIPERRVLYDFTTKGTDPEAADLENWKRLTRAVLSDVRAVTTYGDPQGEPELRNALSSYAFRARGVNADPGNIFIGAGTGPLLHLLCPLFGRDTGVSIEEPGFPLIEETFRDYGFPVASVPYGFLPDSDRALIAELPSTRPRMSADETRERRRELSCWLGESDGRWLLEDDYNGELRYRTRPVPAFQGFAAEKTVYIGSFSKLLLPSVRMAYMVLPPQLAEKARRRLRSLNQTAGKTEQLALASYIREGLLEKHLRRLRRLDQKKSSLIEDLLEEHFGPSVTAELRETSLSFLLRVESPLSPKELEAVAESAGIALRASPDGSGIMLGFSGMTMDRAGEGIERLKAVWAPFLRGGTDGPAGSSSCK